jgi:hypothetical protein
MKPPRHDRPEPPEAAAHSAGIFVGEAIVWWNAVAIDAPCATELRVCLDARR